jgi:AcrR family transcriptional regulator
VSTATEVVMSANSNTSLLNNPNPLTKESGSAASVGRPRAFDLEIALQKALEVFWQKGFEGASLPDLTLAMGINKPSLYAAFGNKEQLFLKALERYENRPGAYFYPSLLAPTAYQVAERILLGAAAEHGDPLHPTGCLMVQAALACSDSGQSVKDALIARRKAGGEKLVARFEQAKLSGDLPADADPQALAGFIITVLQGLSVQATNGADAAQLQTIARTALRAFPVVSAD